MTPIRAYFCYWKGYWIRQIGSKWKHHFSTIRRLIKRNGRFGRIQHDFKLDSLDCLNLDSLNEITHKVNLQAQNESLKKQDLDLERLNYCNLLLRFVVYDVVYKANAELALLPLVLDRLASLHEVKWQFNDNSSGSFQSGTAVILIRAMEIIFFTTFDSSEST